MIIKPMGLCKTNEIVLLYTFCKLLLVWKHSAVLENKINLLVNTFKGVPIKTHTQVHVGYGFFLVVWLPQFFGRKYGLFKCICFSIFSSYLFTKI